MKQTETWSDGKWLTKPKTQSQRAHTSKNKLNQSLTHLPVAFIVYLEQNFPCSSEEFVLLKL